MVGPLADAINWATADSKKWAKALQGNSKALAAFEKATADGESAEDAFNAALAACSDEQERQQLITSALTDLYKDASKAYKTTNKDVIEANKATERWNQAMAKVGGYMEPAVTAVKNLGASLLEDAQEPLKKVAEYITGKLIPGLQSMATWVSSHIPQISGAVVGLTAALVAYKTATFAAELSTKGMTLATYAAAVAQKVLATAMKATPLGLVMTAITAITAGVIAYAAATAAAGPEVDVLTKAERDLMQAANDTAEAFRNQQADTDQQLANIGAQMGKTTELADELFRLADASGKVKEADEGRVQFILNQLNSALGTEYQLVDGEIQRYTELKDSIYGVINAKTANMMLEASNADYIAAVQAKDDALKNLVLTEKDYQAQVSVTKQAEQEYADLNEVLQDRMATARTEADYRSLGSLAQRVESLRLAAEKEKGFLDEKKSAYDDAAYNYGNYTDTIIDYEEAQAAILEGNYDRAMEILKGKDSAYQEYADGVDDATAQAIDALFREAIDAGLAAERIKENFENGVEGYTAEMVQEAEEGYEAALEAYANARADAEGVGSDIGEGLAAGMDSKQGSLVAKARSLVSGIIASMRAAAESHSPSKATMRLGDDMGEGLDIGLEEQTEPLVKTAKRQIGQVVAAYEDGSDLSGADVFRGLAEQQTLRQTQATALARSGTDGKLDKILAAIERGQVLTIDGDLLVGGTADRYDRRLGQQRALAARGAV